MGFMKISPLPLPLVPQESLIAAGSPPAVAKVEVQISWSSVTKVLLGIFAAFLAIRLWPLFQLLFVALLIAVTLWPLRRWTHQKGWPDWVGVALSTLILFSVAVLFAGVVVPALTAQVGTLIERLPTL